MKKHESWSEYQYNIKRIWLDHISGNTVGVYHFHAITLCNLKGENPSNNPKDAKVNYISFKPNQARKDLYVNRQINGVNPNRVTMLKAFVELLLDNPIDWKIGEKNVYVSYPKLGTFYIRQVPCLVLPEYQHLFQLSRQDFTKLVTPEHPFIQSIKIQRKSA